MRVVIDARIPDGAWGGVQQWVIGLAHGLSQLASDTDEYLFLTGPAGAAWLVPHLGDNCRLLYPVKRRAGRRRRIRRRLRRAVRRAWARATSALPVLRRIRPASPAPGPPALIPRSDGTVEGSQPDVVHFPFQSAFLTSVPSLYQPWDLQHLHLPEFFTPAQLERRERTYRAFCAQATLVVAASDWVKRDLIEQYGIEAERIAVVSVPPPTRAYRQPDEDEGREVRERHQLPDRFVYYPAQTWPHKNHARLFEALRLLRDAGLTVPLVCTGQLNASYPALQALAVELGIDADVRFLGFVEPVDVKVLYQTARALVFPSLYEGWGMPIVEAFGADLPVACSNVTSLPELVEDAALVFDPYDPADIAAAIRRLWTDDVLAGDLVRRGRAVAERYDWHRTAMIMRSHYRHVAGLEASAEDQMLRAAAR